LIFFNYKYTCKIENKNKILLKYIVEHGVDINKIVYKNGKIPLFDICESGNKELFKYIELFIIINPLQNVHTLIGFKKVEYFFP